MRIILVTVGIYLSELVIIIPIMTFEHCDYQMIEYQTYYPNMLECSLKFFSYLNQPTNQFSIIRCKDTTCIQYVVVYAKG